MNKELALKLVGDLAKASTRHYQIVNGDRRGKNPAKQELQAARKLLAVLGESATDEEIAQALGW